MILLLKSKRQIFKDSDPLPSIATILPLKLREQANSFAAQREFAVCYKCTQRLRKSKLNSSAVYGQIP